MCCSPNTKNKLKQPGNEAEFSPKKLLRLVLLVWTIWVVFYSIVMYFQIGEIPYWMAFLASAYYNYLFLPLGFFIWWICQKVPVETTPKFWFLLLHLGLAIFISAFWLFIYYGIWYLAQGDAIFKLINVREIIGWQFLFGNVQYFMVAGIGYTIIFYRSYQTKKIAEAELQTLARDAELKALRLQMNPHFLFNSLNSISALVGNRPEQARQMLAQLADLLRMTLDRHTQLLIPLKDELDLVHTYLAIEQIRFADKMVFQEKIDPQLLIHPFPAMLLQPLLENAVKHGIANHRAGGTIALEIRSSDKWLRVSICNPVSAGQADFSDKNGTGLQNVRARLDRMYGKDYSWQVSVANGIFTVNLELPLAPYSIVNSQ